MEPVSIHEEAPKASYTFNSNLTSGALETLLIGASEHANAFLLSLPGELVSKIVCNTTLGDSTSSSTVGEIHLHNSALVVVLWEKLRDEMSFPFMTHLFSEVGLKPGKVFGLCSIPRSEYCGKWSKLKTVKNAVGGDVVGTGYLDPGNPIVGPIASCLLFCEIEEIPFAALISLPSEHELSVENISLFEEAGQTTKLSDFNYSKGISRVEDMKYSNSIYF